MTLDLRLSDQRVDLIGSGFDAAIRIASLDDSRLVARTIDRQQVVTCASPDYVRNRGRPRTPEELARHRCLVYRTPTSGRERAWHFTVDGAVVELAPMPSAWIDEGEALTAAAIAGAGVIQVPDYYVADALASGALVELLKNYRPPPEPVSLVYPTSRQLPARVRVLAERLAALRGTRSS